MRAYERIDALAARADSRTVARGTFAASDRERDRASSRDDRTLRPARGPVAAGHTAHERAARTRRVATVPERRAIGPRDAARSRSQSRSNVRGSLPLSLNVLILGGTLFLGRHLVRELCERGHSVATFTRGRTAADDGFEIARYIGDRDGQLAETPPRPRWEAARLAVDCGSRRRVAWP